MSTVGRTFSSSPSRRVSSFGDQSNRMTDKLNPFGFMFGRSPKNAAASGDGGAWRVGDNVITLRSTRSTVRSKVIWRIELYGLLASVVREFLHSEDYAVFVSHAQCYVLFELRHRLFDWSPHFHFYSLDLSVHIFLSGLYWFFYSFIIRRTSLFFH